MARLSVSCLGPFQVTLDGQPVTDFKSNKVRALLAYLAVEADRPHRREMLAALLWPDWPDREALGNLRYALSDLRRVIGDRTAIPPLLLISRETLQFNADSDYWLDAEAFSKAANHDDLSRQEEAIALYRGSFLEGFSVGDSAAFEEWALFTRERFARQMSSLFHRLAAAYEQRGRFEKAQTVAHQQIELEPWDETAHQQLMRALALSGQRSTALAQYETCRRLLAEELGVEPSQETTTLYHQIRDGGLPGPTSLPAESPGLTAAPPPFLVDSVPQAVEIPVFVSRERELAQLDGWLEQALAGQGRVAFVTGEAGSGKTALVQEFTRQAQGAHARLIVATGNCNAYTGLGDPYLPFREILELLTGDVEARWAAGAMTADHARRLWNAVPYVAEALVETGPDLIDTLVPRAALLQRARSCASGRPAWLTRLGELVERRLAGQGLPSPQQSDLFEQYTRALQALTQQGPLLLAVDDLQWADLGSISLLFHLGRHLVGSRILILGAYRPEEVAIGRDGGRHPLQPVVNEFQRDFGDITVDLSQAESNDFLTALLDTEPNHLGPSFKAMLYQRTRGHPLFTVELLRGLQERGDLVQDAEGCWVEAPALNWQTLPARVEAVIAERLGRLGRPLRAALRVASVEGEVFTAEVVARVQAADSREMVGRLSGELDRRHRLVRAQAIERLGSRRASRYRFRNYLFQRYLYDSLDTIERAYLHEDIGNALEELYGEDASEYAVQLAWHFQEAGIAEKAIHYLHQAGDRAVRLSAYQDGRTLLSRALALLQSLPDSGDYDRRSQLIQKELDLQLSLGIAWKAGIPDPEGEKVLTRARELCEQAGMTTQLCQVLGELSVYPYVRAEYQAALDLGEQTLRLAEQVGDPLLVALAQWHLGYVLFGLGEFSASHARLQQVLSFYDPQKSHHAFVAVRGSDAGVSALAYDACCLWCLGYPEQSIQRSRDALSLARELDHAFTLADVLCFGGALFHSLRRDAHALRDSAEEFTRLCAGLDFSSFWGTGTCYEGEALTRFGRFQEGLVEIRQGMEVRQSVGARCYLSGILGAVAEAKAEAGQPEDGLDTLAEALAFIEETGERYYEAELFRLQAEFLLRQGNNAGAEASLQKALDVARRQGAKLWELRAAVSLCRLWQEEGRGDEARQTLAGIYSWFTEGFDTPDLQEAKALLDELG